MQVIAYTDGSSRGNPGPGGYGLILMVEGTNYSKKISGGFRKTTNNRMELLAVIVALETLTKANQEIIIITDSKYVFDSITKRWVWGWQKKGFKGKKNPDLWRRLLKIYPKHQVKMQWVKGHNGNKYNEIADQLAVRAATQKGLTADIFYENNT